MTSKNAFEIRADMVKLAKDYMDAQHTLNVQFITDMYKEGQKSYEELQQAYQMYSMEDLMKKAQDMYSFVSNKDNK